MDTKSTVAFAMATATLLLAGCSSESKSNEEGDQAQQTLVKCEGANECKGTSECKSPSNSNGCQGLNECKGQGYISIPKSDCDAKGGHVFAEMPHDDPSAAPDPNTTGDAGDSGNTTASVKCLGINECKGHGDCAGAGNECKGQNDCAGKGFLELPSESQCLEEGGTVQG